MKWKKYISLVLICLLTLNAGGYYLIYLGLLLNFKDEASRRINDFIADSEMTLVKVPGGDFISKGIHWTEDNEFEMNDEMYDVFKKENINVDLYLYCLADKNEDQLNKAFSNFIDKFSKDTNKNIVKNIINLYLALSMPALAPDASTVIFRNDFTDFVPTYSILYESIFPGISTPPPRA